MKKIRFMDRSLRGDLQSVFGARALTDDFLPAVDALLGSSTVYKVYGYD